MNFKRLVPVTIRGQITVIIIVALLVVIVAGRALEQWADNAAPDVESIAVRVNTIAELLEAADPNERNAILETSSRVGWQLSLEPYAASESFTGPPKLDGSLGLVIDWLFPTGNVRPPRWGLAHILEG